MDIHMIDLTLRENYPNGDASNIFKLLGSKQVRQIWCLLVSHNCSAPYLYSAE